jgi:hypothetical protein
VQGDGGPDIQDKSLSFVEDSIPSILRVILSQTQQIIKSTNQHINPFTSTVAKFAPFAPIAIFAIIAIIATTAPIKFRALILSFVEDSIPSILRVILSQTQQIIKSTNQHINPFTSTVAKFAPFAPIAIFAIIATTQSGNHA